MGEKKQQEEPRMGIWQVAATAGDTVQSKGPTLFFCMWITSFPAPLLKTLLSPTEWFWYICEKRIGCRYVGLVLGSQFLPILYVYPYASTVAL